MSSLNFPTDPEIGDPYLGWVWDGSEWVNKAEAITTADITLTNPQRSDLNTQEDANQYLAEQLDQLDPNDFVKKVWPGTQHMVGVNNQLSWSTDTNDPGPYTAIIIGQGSGVGGGRDGAAFYVETENGSYEIDNYSMYIRGGKLEGGYGATIAGFDSIQATDFLDADGNSIVGEQINTNDFVKKVWGGTQHMDGVNNQLSWDQTASDPGPYDVIVIGQGTGMPGRDGAAFYVETENGSYQINNYYMEIREGKLVGDGSEILGFTSVQANDFLDADGNSIIGAGGGGSSLWEQNGDNIYYSNGRVSIGDDSSDATLSVCGDGSGSPKTSIYISDKTTGYGARIESNHNEVQIKAESSIGETDARMVLSTGNYTGINIGKWGRVGVGADWGALEDIDRALHVKSDNEIVATFESRNRSKSRIAFTSDGTSGLDMITGIGCEDFDLLLYAAGGDPWSVKINDEGLILNENLCVQATDFLDADGNSIIGGGDVDLSNYYTKAESDAAFSTFSGSYNDLSNKPTIPTNNNQLTNGAGYVDNNFIPTAIVDGSGGVAIGAAYGFGGSTYYLYPSTADGFNFDSKGCLGDGGRRWAVVHAETYYKGGALLPSVADMADVFRTLQTAIADEDDPAAMKEALVNALGGLIEQFEGYERADPE